VTTRESLHALIDRLPEDSVELIQRLAIDIEADREETLAQLRSILEVDEPLTEKERRAVERYEAGLMRFRSGDEVDELLASAEAGSGTG
jgi:hypothetical protein